MDKQRYLVLIAVAVVVGLMVFVISFSVTAYSLLTGTVPTGEERGSVLAGDTPDPLVLQGRIWELTDENTSLKEQVAAYEDMLATSDQNAAEAMDAANALEDKLKSATRPIVVQAQKTSQTGSQSSTDTLPQPPLIPEWNQ